MVNGKQESEAEPTRRDYQDIAQNCEQIAQGALFALRDRRVITGSDVA